MKKYKIKTMEQFYTVTFLFTLVVATLTLLVTLIK